MPPRKLPIFEIVVPALRAIALATTLLVVVLALLAARNGSSLGDLYAKYFPQLRGSDQARPLPVYFGFVVYVVGAAEAAIFFRRSAAAPPRRRHPRPFGLAAGTFVVPDDFDDPLPEDVLRDFEQ
jgi:hypothetical protein